MGDTRRLVCLANSKKRSGRCVAGYDQDDARWIRPIGETNEGTVPIAHTYLDNGEPLAVLDVFEIKLDEPRPDSVQPENYLYSQAPWVGVSRLDSDAACALLTELSHHGPELFGSTGESVHPSELGANAQSLLIIEPEELQWRVETGFYGGQRVRAQFQLGGQPYELTVTDPQFLASFGDQPLGVYGVTIGDIREGDRIWLTISLTEPFERTGDCYKLVAAVIAVHP
jgi:Dual OB-containing domain